MIEFCRQCRDNDDQLVEADFILWGKLFPKGALGPRCYNCAAQWLGPGMRTLDQYAVFDLRPYKEYQGEGHA